MLVNFANGGITSGVTKYIAEYGSDHVYQKTIIKTGLSVAFYCSLILGLVNFVFAEKLSFYLFHTTAYVSIFRILAFTLVFASLNSTLLAVLNGYKQIKLYISIGILTSLAGLVLTFILALNWQVYGAILSLVLTQTIIGTFTLIYVRNFEWFSFDFLSLKTITRSVIIKLSGYTAMALTSACAVPISQILIRNYIADNFSMAEAGYWQAVWKISEVYLMIITTSLATYYLPRLSEISCARELRQEIIRGYKFLLPTTVIMSACIYYLRDHIILILFTPQFMPMKELFLFQLIGDVLKISSWLLAYLMLAKAMIKTFIITEIIFAVSFVSLTQWFAGQYGLVGVTYGYAVNYAIYFLLMIVLIGRRVLIERL